MRTTLIDSSAKTRRWLDLIKARVAEIMPYLEYGAHKFWATLRNPETGHNVVYMHPTINQIRLFNMLPIIDGEPLNPSPSSKNWEDAYPSIFTLRSENEIPKAVNCIMASSGFDMGQQT